MAIAEIIPPSRFEVSRKLFLKRGFGSPLPVAISVLVFALLRCIAWSFLDWAVLRAVWSKENVKDCGHGGTCWAVIDARHRLILVGTYPFDPHWRSTLAVLAIVVTIVLSCLPAMWQATRLATLWIAGFATYYLLMEGSLLGLQQVTTDGWGGLSLTLFLFAAVVLLGMPIGLGLALMRRSQMPVVRWFAVLIIDTIHSLPLVTTLFTAAVVVPLFLPSWLEGDKIWRVILASGKTAFGTADWAPYYIEVYLFVAAICWVFIFSLGQYGEYLKGRMALSER